MNLTPVKLPILRRFLWRLLRGYNYIFLVTAALLSVIVAVVPAEHKFHLFGPTLSISICAALIVAVLAVRLNRYPHVWRPWQTVAVFGGLLVIQLLVAWALTSTGSGWDSQIVLDQAVRYAQTGAIDPALVDYFRTYPNNVALLSILATLFRGLSTIGITDFATAATFMNALVLWLSLVMLYLVARRLYGAAVARLTWPLGLLLLVLSPQISTVYTDTLAMIFPISLWYVALKIVAAGQGRRRFAWLILAAVLSVIGILVKPTVIMATLAALIAFGVWILLKPATPGQWRHRRRITICGAIVLGLVSLCTYALYIKSVDALAILPYPAVNMNQEAMPAEHYMAIGMKASLQDGIPAYGVYSAQALANMTALPDRQSRVEYARNDIWQQLSEYGVFGYADFLLKKMVWILSDGTFYAYGEGNTQLDFYHHDPLSQRIRQFLYVGGWGYGGYSNMAQAVWLAVLLLVALPVARLRNARRNSFGFTTLVPRLMLTGLVIFILLFEGRARYLFLYVPVIIGLGLYTLKIFETDEIPAVK